MLSRSSIILICFLFVMGIGAIYVARQFRSKLSSPAGLRVTSTQRLRALHQGLLHYFQYYDAYPDSRLTLIRVQKIGIGLAAGHGYRQPGPTSAPSDVVLWRDQVLPGVKAGEPWAGAKELATTDIPTIGQAVTLDGTVLDIPEAEFVAFVPQWQADRQAERPAALSAPVDTELEPPPVDPAQSSDASPGPTPALAPAQ